ncbi:MAG: hypothetical protein AAGJ81_12925 [Verrucomicrobiota bacterium]
MTVKEAKGKSEVVVGLGDNERDEVLVPVYLYGSFDREIATGETRDPVLAGYLFGK